MMTTTALKGQKSWQNLGKNDSLVITNLSVNSPKDDYRPIYIDGVLYFTSSRYNRNTDEAELKYNENIYTARYIDSAWSSPKKYYFFNSDDYTAIIGYSRYGALFTYKTFGNGDIYSSTYGTKKWLRPKKMKVPINSDFHEQSIAKDNGIIVISSDRDGKGDYDLYWSSTRLNGQFVDFLPLDAVNTTGDEVDVNFGSDGKTLYFSSNGRGGKGGYDIYFTVLDSSGHWSKPQSLSINSVNNDRGFLNCDSMYFVTRDSGVGGDDIYWGHIVPKWKPKPKKKIDTVIVKKPDTNIIVVKRPFVDTTLLVKNLIQLNKRPTEQVFFTSEGKPDSVREKKFMKIYDVLDSLNFQVHSAYVQIGAYYYLRSISEFKYNYPAFDTTKIFVEKVETNRGTLYKYIIDKEYKTLKESAIRQQEALRQQTDQANRYKIVQGDAFIAVYDKSGKRILIFFNVYTGACRILSGDTVIYF